MLLVSFVAGLTGSPGRQVRYRNPQTLQEAISVALSVQEAEKQERFNESFCVQFDRSVRLLSRSTRGPVAETTGRGAQPTHAQ